MSERGFPYLRMNERMGKPRTRGITEIRGPTIRRWAGAIWRIFWRRWASGWIASSSPGGAFTLMPRAAVREITDLAHRYQVTVSTGGFIEYVLTQGHDAVNRYIQECQELGFDIIEISSGFITIPTDDWLRLVEQVQKMGLKAKPEVGIQFGAGGASAPEELAAEGTRDVSWAIQQIKRFIAAGAYLIMIESEGITEEVKTWRTDVPARIIDAVGLEKVMFEAADPAVFGWYIKNYGPEVNLFVDHSQIHHGSGKRSLQIALDVTFTEESEKNLLCAFLAASFCNENDILRAIQQRPNQPAQLNPEGLAWFSTWIHQHLCLEAIEWLFVGRLTTAYDGIRWRSWYELHPDALSFPLRLRLDFSVFFNGEVGNSLSTMSFFASWRESLSDQERAALDRCLSGSAPPPELPALDILHLLSGLPLEQRGLSLGVRNQRSLLKTDQTYDQTVGLPRGQQNFPHNASRLFQILLDRGFVFTDNVRRVPRYQFSLDDFHAPNINLSDADQLVLYLFRLRNGTLGDQQHYRAIQGTFSDLTGHQFAFDVRLADPAPRASEAEKSGLRFQIDIANEGRDIPLEFSGAGITEALFLSTLIAGGKGRVMLLDEPALNLHPTMQTTLLSMIQAPQVENQFVIVTHSPSCLPLAAISGGKVSRFFMRQGATSRAALDHSQMDEQQAATLKQELRSSADARALLLSRGVILVEGETELGVLPV
jgi:phosphosulfolactate synthase (CoM biosynthesis protein A)